MYLLSQLFSTGKVGKQGEILIWLELMISVSIATLTNKKNYYFSLGANGSWMGGYEINGWELNEWQLILFDISLLPHRSLEVLLQHLSLQDVDVRDNEVRCVMHVNPSCNHNSPHQQQSFIIHLTTVYVTNKDRKIEGKPGEQQYIQMQKRSKNQCSKYWM